MPTVFDVYKHSLISSILVFLSRILFGSAS